MKRTISCLCLSLAIATNAQANKVQVATSIKPLQLIAQDLLGTSGEASYIVPPGASPHDYSLKPSDIRKLRSADVVFWVGPDLEQFLAKAVSQHPNSTALLPLFEGLAGQEGHEGHDHGDHEEHQDEHAKHDDHEEHHDEHAKHDDHEEHHDEHAKHDDHEEHHDEHAKHDDHEEHGDDPHAGHNHDKEVHIWLNPVDAELIAREMAKQISAARPELAEEMAANLARYQAELKDLDNQLKAQLTPLQQQNFIVFHDAYQQFIGHYGLKQAAALTINPTRRPGAKHIAKIKQLISDNNVVCIFSEPQFRGAAIDSIIHGTGLATAELDPLAGNTAKGQGYATFLTELASSFNSCLANK